MRIGFIFIFLYPVKLNTDSTDANGTHFRYSKTYYIFVTNEPKDIKGHIGKFVLSRTICNLGCQVML